MTEKTHWGWFCAGSLNWVVWSLKIKKEELKQRNMGPSKGKKGQHTGARMKIRPHDKVNKWWKIGIKISTKPHLPSKSADHSLWSFVVTASFLVRFPKFPQQWESVCMCFHKCYLLAHFGWLLWCSWEPKCCHRQTLCQSANSSKRKWIVDHPTVTFVNVCWHCIHEKVLTLQRSQSCTTVGSSKANLRHCR